MISPLQRSTDLRKSSEQRVNGEAVAHARAFWLERLPSGMEVEEAEVEEGDDDAERLEGDAERLG